MTLYIDGQIMAKISIESVSSTGSSECFCIFMGNYSDGFFAVFSFQNQHL